MKQPDECYHTCLILQAFIDLIRQALIKPDRQVVDESSSNQHRVNEVVTTPIIIVLLSLLCSGLSELNVAGNQLFAMPAGLLQLRRLDRLNVANNLMHPVFWQDAVAHEPEVNTLIVTVINVY